MKPALQTIHMIRMRLNEQMEPYSKLILEGAPLEEWIDGYGALCARWLRSTRYWAKVADHPGTPRQRHK